MGGGGVVMLGAEFLLLLMIKVFIGRKILSGKTILAFLRCKGWFLKSSQGCSTAPSFISITGSAN